MKLHRRTGHLAHVSGLVSLAPACGDDNGGGGDVASPSRTLAGAVEIPG